MHVVMGHTGMHYSVLLLCFPMHSPGYGAFMTAQYCKHATTDNRVHAEPTERAHLPLLVLYSYPVL